MYLSGASEPTVVYKEPLPGNPKKYSCLIKNKMHNKREIFKIKIVLNCQ